MWCFATTAALGLAIDDEELRCRQFPVCKQHKLGSLDSHWLFLSIGEVPLCTGAWQFPDKANGTVVTFF